MQDFDTPEPILAVLDLPAGIIRVNAGDRADTVVEIRPSDRRNDADVQAAANTGVEYADGRLLIRTGKADAGQGLSLDKLLESPTGWARTLLFGQGSVDVTIDLPAGSRLDVKAAASLRCTGPLGEVTATTSHGDLRVEQAGRVRLKSTHGDISVTRATGPAEVTTTYGDIHVGEAGGAAWVKTSHGDVRLGRVAGELRLNSAHGEINVDRALGGVFAKTAHAGVRIGEASSGSIVMETTGGGLDLGIRAGSAAWLDVSSRYGSVDVSLDPSDAPAEADQIVEVRAHTAHGDIVIHRS